MKGSLWFTSFSPGYLRNFLYYIGYQIKIKNANTWEVFWWLWPLFHLSRSHRDIQLKFSRAYGARELSHMTCKSPVQWLSYRPTAKQTEVRVHWETTHPHQCAETQDANLNSWHISIWAIGNCQWPSGQARPNKKFLLNVKIRNKILLSWTSQ